jgi:hypothetical protein
MLQENPDGHLFLFGRRLGEPAYINTGIVLYSIRYLYVCERNFDGHVIWEVTDPRTEMECFYLAGNINRGRSGRRALKKVGRALRGNFSRV